jgi:hypothetical protein
MMNWFKKKKAAPKSAEQVQKVPLKLINYHPKIILAWAKAIEGNDEFMIWLKENGFPELTIATHAIYLKEEARDWLTNNGYPHLMAMINAAEGNEMAQKWLLAHDFEILYHIALAVEDDQDSWEWLGDNVTADMFILAQTIKKVKDQIEENHNDVHTFGKDI